MGERYSRLFSLENNLYTLSSPVLIAAGALLKDSQTGHVLVQLKFKNITPTQVAYVRVKITPFDFLGRPLGNPLEKQYLDLHAARDSEFGQKSPLILPDNTTRSFTAEILEIGFTDKTIWTAPPNANWSSLPKQETQTASFVDPEIAKQFSLEFGGTYVPLETSALWFCTCGSINNISETACHHCNRSHSVLQNIDMDVLTAHKDKRLEDERIAAENARTELEARAAEYYARKTRKKKFTIKLSIICSLIIAIIAVFLIILKTLIIPTSKYNAASSLMNCGQYSEAIVAFEALDGYKDSDAQIENCRIALKDIDYNAAVALMDQQLYDEAIEAFEAMDGYRDSDTQIENCQTALKDIDYDAAIALMEQGQYDEAIEAFEAMDGYRDSDAQIESCQTALKDIDYDAAVALMELGDYENAIDALDSLEGYRDVDSLLATMYKEYIGDLNIGDTFYFGHSGRKIEWRILAKSGDNILVISEYVLSMRSYNTDWEKVTWESCEMREHLNNAFYNTAFTDAEKTFILTTTINTPDNPDYGTTGGEDTQDKLFLLTVSEAYEYFSSAEDRIARALEGNTVGWGLRTPGKNNYINVRVSYDGSIDTDGSTGYCGVRPAMWLSLGV